MTTTDTDTLAELEAAYIEALADETAGAHGRAMQIASDPMVRDSIMSVSRDRDAVRHVRIALRQDHISAKRLGELHKLRDKAETNLARTEATLAEAQNVADAAKREHEQLRAKTSACEHSIESVRYICTTQTWVARALADEVKAAGLT